MRLKPLQRTREMPSGRTKFMCLAPLIEAPRRANIRPAAGPPMAGSAITSPYQDRHVRPQIQRTFLRWFKTSRTRFAVPPLIVRRTDRRLTLAFAGITPLISAFLSSENINVVVEIDRTSMDTLFDSDLFLKRDQHGYFCALCNWQSRENHPSRESLWIEHVFEPFLRWVNDALAPAKWLRLLNVDNGAATSARLIQIDEEINDSDPELYLLHHLKNLDGEAAFASDRNQVNATLHPIYVRAPRSTGAPP